MANDAEAIVAALNKISGVLNEIKAVLSDLHGDLVSGQLQIVCVSKPDSVQERGPGSKNLKRRKQDS